MTLSTLLLRQCPHCETNLVDAELLLAHTCEPGAFHSRLLGVRDPGGDVTGWKCPDCSHLLPLTIGLTIGQPVDTTVGTTAASYRDLVDKIDELETLVMSIADALEGAHIGVRWEISQAREWYNRPRVESLQV
jgi:hypothetical protein